MLYFKHEALFIGLFIDIMMIPEALEEIKLFYFDFDGPNSNGQTFQKSKVNIREIAII